MSDRSLVLVNQEMLLELLDWAEGEIDNLADCHTNPATKGIEPQHVDDEVVRVRRLIRELKG